MASEGTGQLKDRLQLGTLEVKVLEVREIPIHLFIVRYENAEKSSEVKKHASDTHQFNDVFSFRIMRLQGDIEVEAWRKHKLLKDKMEGFYRIPLTKLEDKVAHSGWFPLIPADKKSLNSTHEVAEDQKIGEVRLEITFTLSAKPKEVLHGIVFENKWTAATSGGSLMNNREWTKNHQYLLNVDRDMEVTLRLRLPESGVERGSFYVVRYDDKFYQGRKKVVMDNTEIIKVESFFCPITAYSVDSTMFLNAGDYIVVPFTEAKDFVGDFTINAYAKEMDGIDFVYLPKKEADADIGKPGGRWAEKHLEGEWTAETAGGGDILTLAWSRNPQYLLTLSDTAEVAVVLSQEDNVKSIGFYVIKQQDSTHRAISYDNEVGRTDGFKYVCAIGAHFPRLVGPASYVIIPATFEPELTGAFRVSVYSSDPNMTLEPSTHGWKHSKQAEGKWEGATAGGAPNVETFINNPQFTLRVPPGPPGPVLVQLVQEASRFEEASIGFLVVGRAADASGKVAQSDLFKQKDPSNPVLTEGIVAQPEGWVQKMDVLCRLALGEEGGQFVVIPSTFKAGVDRPFALLAYGDRELNLEGPL
eukprot:TRINITY_DN468_c0_g1_i3.p1 TRINITY_DN468_c0_g1~~TRINITY_DN468_c0_g1_i3.p1  ORF type:complete len:586 (+),score=151.09 TRINITY_DN468_c0_g1_i3:26-1783(+)